MVGNVFYSNSIEAQLYKPITEGDICSENARAVLSNAIISDALIRKFHCTFCSFKMTFMLTIVEEEQHPSCPLYKD